MEALAFEHPQRSLDVQCADCGAGVLVRDKKNIAASKELYLDIFALGADRVQLPGHVANREVNEASARREADAAARLNRRNRQHGMTQGSGSEPRGPESNPDAGAEHGTQHRGLPHQP